MRSWNEIYEYFKKYEGGCRDGALGEGLSESVTVMLDEHWTQFNELKRLVQKDTKFLEWVVYEFTGYPEDECAIVRALTKLEQQCPKDDVKICSAFAERARRFIPLELAKWCAPNSKNELISPQSPLDEDKEVDEGINNDVDKETEKEINEYIEKERAQELEVLKGSE